METKRDIRKQMLCARDRLTDREWETYSDRITEQVVSHPLFVQAKEIWCYVSMGKEVCTEQILVSAWRAGKRTAVPKVTGKREMKFGAERREKRGRLLPGKIGSLDACSRRFVRSGGKKDRIWRRILRHVSSENGRMPYVWTCV